MEFRVLKYFGLAAFFLMFSCTKEIKIPIPGYEEKLVIDGRIETGQPPFVLISKTKDIYSPTDLNSFLNGFISGAIVTVSDGQNTVVLQEFCSDNLPPGSEELAANLFGIPAEDLDNYHICAYSTFNPVIFGQVGKKYTLTVSFEGKTYTSETEIVSPVSLDRTFWKSENSTPGYGFSWATLSDPADRYNAYYWEVKRINLDSTGQERDGVFRRTFNPTFDDEFVNGTTFDFAYENPMSSDEIESGNPIRGLYKQGDTVVIKFSSLDAGVYNYLESKFIQLSNGGSPFAVPVNLPTNIQGGALGLWAGFSPVFDTLICQP